MLPFDMGPVLNEFLTLITCYDVESVMSDYELQKIQGPDYSIAGVLIPPTDLDIAMFDEGEIRQGAMILYTYSTTKLFYQDMQNQQDRQKQTFVRFNGDIYRIKGMSPRAHDGLHYKWTMTRYVER